MKVRRDDLCADGFQDEVEGVGALNSNDVPFLSLQGDEPSVQTTRERADYIEKLTLTCFTS